MRFIHLEEEYASLIKKYNSNSNFEDNIIKIGKYNILLFSHLFVGTPEYVSPEVQRIGYNSKDYSEINNHPFFNGIKFEDPSILEYREVLEKLGYKLLRLGEENTEDKQNINLEKELYEDKKEMDIDDNIDIVENN